MNDAALRDTQEILCNYANRSVGAQPCATQKNVSRAIANRSVLRDFAPKICAKNLKFKFEFYAALCDPKKLSRDFAQPKFCSTNGHN